MRKVILQEIVSLDGYASKTLKRAPWGNWGEGRIVKGNPADEVANLKK